MEFSTHPSRRQMIVGVGAGALALAGCSPTATESGTPGGQASQPADGQSSGEPKEGTTLTALDQVKVGEAVLVKADGAEVLVCRHSEQEAVAYSAICTHKGCTVEPSGQELVCPCHQSKFNPSDGAVLGGPASAPLAKIAVHVKSGQVVTGTA